MQGKKRNFVETVELQVTLKQIDPAKDKRFAGSFVLPNPTRDHINVCIFVNDKHEQICKKENIPCMNVDEITNLNKNKKLIRKLAKKYDAFLASDTLIKKLPRLMGPGLNRAGKFPSVITNSEDPAEKINGILHTVKFQMKKVLCLSVPVGHVNLNRDQLKTNVVLSVTSRSSTSSPPWDLCSRCTSKRITERTNSVGSCYPLFRLFVSDSIMAESSLLIDPISKEYDLVESRRESEE